MTEKRKYTRYNCKIKSSYDYFTGNPEEIDMDISVPHKGKGTIFDISQGGVFIVSNDKVQVGLPIKISFKIRKEHQTSTGKIVRTGLIKNNPSEIAQHFINHTSKGDSYIAVEFDTPLESLDENDL